VQGSRGFALIVVLWFLVLIAAISSYLIANARQETAIARNILTAATAEALADAGVAQAVFNQLSAVEDARWSLDGAPHPIRLAEGELTIRLFDERQKINPNRADEGLLVGLFEAVGLEQPLARRLGASVADWVDRDSEPRPLGAEREQYAQAGRSYAPPNLRLESLDELQLVLGLTPQVYAAVRPYLTIHSNAERPDVRSALPLIQRALVLAPRRPTQIEASDTVVENENLTADERATAEAEQELAATDEQSTNAIIALDVTARTVNGGTFVRHAVLRIDPGSPKGYVVLEWRRGNSP
jgi:general secretion pathway protein K